jgi:hypothetical protein
MKYKDIWLYGTGPYFLTLFPYFPIPLFPSFPIPLFHVHLRPLIKGIIAE